LAPGEHGAAVYGEIVDIEMFRSGKFGHSLEITFRYPSGLAKMVVSASRYDTGRPISSGARDRSAVEGVSVPGAKIGDRVTMLYDPTHPSSAIAYEFSFFR
jgi:hypothetical protein